MLSQLSSFSMKESHDLGSNSSCTLVAAVCSPSPILLWIRPCTVALHLLITCWILASDCIRFFIAIAGVSLAPNLGRSLTQFSAHIPVKIHGWCWAKWCQLPRSREKAAQCWETHLCSEMPWIGLTMVKKCPLHKGACSLDVFTTAGHV